MLPSFQFASGILPLSVSATAAVAVAAAAAYAAAVVGAELSFPVMARRHQKRSSSSPHTRTLAGLLFFSGAVAVSLIDAIADTRRH